MQSRTGFAMNLAREVQYYLSNSKKQRLSTITEDQMATAEPPPIKLKADSFSYVEAMKCFVVEEDKQKLQVPIPLGKEATSIRVSKKNTRHSENKLEFVVTGPGEALVEVCEECEGVERCDVTPTKPGEYCLDVFWNGKPIRGSPYSLVFKQTQIFSGGLDLDTVNYRLGVEHKFKLDCSDLKSGDLQVTISPPTAGRVEVSCLSEKQPDTYQCKIVPLEIGRHVIAVMYSGNHIYGSPYTVEFGHPGDASKCILSTSTVEHKVGNKVFFEVDTKEAGFGHLRAGVRDVVSNKSVKLLVTRTSQDRYTLEFDPGSSSECLLTIKYDNVHIKGSPFQLLFNELANCTAEGPGLVSAQAKAWNMFSVKAEKSCEHQGTLKVSVLNSNRERVETVVSSRSPLHFDVSYFPKSPGVYTVSLQWGEAQVPGSPFHVTCQSASLAIADRPVGDVPLGSSIDFSVRPLCCVQDKSDVLCINARDSAGRETLGRAVWDEKQQVYRCTLRPDRIGKYPISVKSRDAHIVGSPFVVTVIDPPSPQLVRAWGCGLVGATLTGKGEFTVDVSKAGAGLLSVSVRDYEDGFKINTTRTPGKGLFKVSYNSQVTGSFLMDVKWSGEHIPLSPFNITVSSKKSDVDKLNSLDKHEMFLGNITSVGVNGDWLKVWRSSGRLKKKFLNGQKIKPEEALTYF